MKIRTMMILLSALLLVSAQAFGQAITLDSVSSASLKGTDTLKTGGTIKFYIRFNNNTAENVTGYSNGFRIYSADGAQWTSSSIDTLSDASARGWGLAQLTGGIYFNTISGNGQGEDTVGIAGIAFGVGVPAGTSNIAAAITIGPIPTGAAYHQKQICIDSTWYPPGNDWLWSGTPTEFQPSWPAPYCYTIWDQSTGVGDGVLEPYTFSLAQNYPNPFNPTTSISYSLAEKSHVELSVYNVLGQKIAVLVSEEQAAGKLYTAEWDGASVASGVYFYRLETEKFTSTKKMLLVK